jgi:hypothetical protein
MFVGFDIIGHDRGDGVIHQVDETILLWQDIPLEAVPQRTTLRGMFGSINRVQAACIKPLDEQVESVGVILWQPNCGFDDLLELERDL